MPDANHPEYGAQTLNVSVDCAACPGRTGTVACAECIVAYLTDRDPDDAIVFDVNEERALRLLERAGLLGEIVSRVTLGATA